jgi:glycosyltransferase involved in cell wall biosynthesis
MSMFEARDAFADWTHVPSKLVFEGIKQSTPLLSIAIPTFRRGTLLFDSVKSALNQDWDGAYEIIILDNDPESAGPGALLEAIPALREASFRYYVNSANLGMFGNWNRSIELARGEWYTMLHDDDLLTPDFASRMMSVLRNDPKVEGLVCRKRSFGLINSEPTNRLKTLARAVWLDARYLGRAVRPYRPSRFFWGAGNPVGWIARKQDLIALGGYQPEEYPGSDHVFELRFALQHRLYESRHLLANIRFQENESLKMDTLSRMIVASHSLRMKMAGTVVPAWWGTLSPMMVQRDRVGAKERLGSEIDQRALEEACDLRLPKDRPKLLAAICGVLGGY